MTSSGMPVLFSCTWCALEANENDYEDRKAYSVRRDLTDEPESEVFATVASWTLRPTGSFPLMS